MSDPTFTELLAQREALERKIAQAREREIEVALREIHERMDLLGISIADLAKARKAPPPRKVTLPAKYRDPATGQTWAGRGRLPAWMNEALKAGKTRESFLV